jgi:hypothetical protein
MSALAVTALLVFAIALYGRRPIPTSVLPSPELVP